MIVLLGNSFRIAAARSSTCSKLAVKGKRSRRHGFSAFWAYFREGHLKLNLTELKQPRKLVESHLTGLFPEILAHFMTQ